MQLFTAYLLPVINNNDFSLGMVGDGWTYAQQTWVQLLLVVYKRNGFQIQLHYAD